MRAKKPSPPLERDVSKAIVEYFAAVYKITLHRRNTGAMLASYGGKKRMVRFSAEGQADLWGIVPHTGRHIEIEVKRLGNEPDEDQKAWLRECAQSGAIAMWANSTEMAAYWFERNLEARAAKNAITAAGD